MKTRGTFESLNAFETRKTSREFVMDVKFEAVRNPAHDNQDIIMKCEKGN